MVLFHLINVMKYVWNICLVKNENSDFSDFDTLEVINKLFIFSQTRGVKLQELLLILEKLLMYIKRLDHQKNS